MFFENVIVLKKERSLNNKWRRLFESKQMTIGKIDIDLNSKFFCMGSCFAEYVRNSLESRNKKCYPNYSNLIFDKPNQMVDLIVDLFLQSTNITN